ncbi:hypothetical protein R6Q59_009004 [Mikania micrantha]
MELGWLYTNPRILTYRQLRTLTLLQPIQIPNEKPFSSACYKSSKENNPPLCDENIRLKTSWYTPLDGYISTIPVTYKWPTPWPQRLESKPLSLSTDPEAEQVYCCFKSLTDLPVWVMNIVSVNGSDTLPVIFDTGLIGIYHDWCESLSTYPRTYDLQYSSFLFGNLTSRCDMLDIAVEMDRILDQLEDSGRYHRNVKEVETYFAVASLVNRLTSGEISCGKDRFLASRNYTINKIF